MRSAMVLFCSLFLTSTLLPAQVDREKEFRSMPEASNIRSYVKRLSARPHHVGSAYDKDNAEWILAHFKEWGLDARIESFNVLFPTPRERAVELVAPTRFVARLQEPAVSVDPTSGQTSEQLPTYNAYSADGDVTAPLVYVNYGTPDDYDRLDRMGISVKGCIVITRYGAVWRGTKPKVAAEHGAVGCLIFSDPSDDGYTQGDVYPRGPFRPKEGVQRGSVMDMPVYPGDPLTPDIGATKDARRLKLSDAKTITKIPVLPLSYGDAQPLLAALDGPVAPEGWRGTLPLTYHVGPGPARVHLRVKSNWDLKPIYDVIGMIRGSKYPDEWVIRGNHHDAWVNGTEDPVSGQAALMEEARCLGAMMKEGWKPKRTIVYCAWDGEEEGLLGSTEWAEEHADQLRRNAVAYINSDANGRGYLGVAGSHSLQAVVNDVARDVTDPETHLSVWKRNQLLRIERSSNPEDRRSVREEKDLRIGALGSGSDYTVFLDHLGIASVNIGFGGEDDGGIYHSIYDDYYWYTHFSDTSFVYGEALAQTGGSLVMRLADAQLLPFSFGEMAATYGRYVDDLQKLAKAKRDEAIERDEEIKEGVFQAVADPRVRSVPPPPLDLPPYLNFAPLQNAIDSLKRASGEYEKAIADSSRMTDALAARLNLKMIRSERLLTNAEGLPGRPWFQHEIYAPGLYTGYGVKTIPAVREAIEQRNWEEAEKEIGIVANLLNREAGLISSMAAEIPRR